MEAYNTVEILVCIVNILDRIVAVDASYHIFVVQGLYQLVMIQRP